MLAAFAASVYAVPDTHWRDAEPYMGAKGPSPKISVA
jgi:hypothetical protein